MPDTIKYLLASMLEKYFATSDFNDDYQTHLTCYADTLFTECDFLDSLDSIEGREILSRVDSRGTNWLFGLFDLSSTPCLLKL